ncbi:hypothetical protein AFE_0222 [Acidithiobacillus ferrooxidans ATCC 23270]|uniref:Uncharacterized protein n=1 Tax=Acidithiobacillus ferrooxidans (strain ATCC 23270 / DSM 14882 / CIP 104768 / NCIMB 8455) TaxID=243159 RepID=B7J3W6_ACIF2|nr:hypothetical protein AFE_0222 [Acidithiobacillus ferrooxidans ATCC 23270]
MLLGVAMICVLLSEKPGYYATAAERSRIRQLYITGRAFG